MVTLILCFTLFFFYKNINHRNPLTAAPHEPPPHEPPPTNRNIPMNHWVGWIPIFACIYICMFVCMYCRNYRHTNNNMWVSEIEWHPLGMAGSLDYIWVRCIMGLHCVKDEFGMVAKLMLQC